MSIEIMSKAWKNSRQSGARLLALLALADRADEDGVCWPGRQWIADRARVQSGKNIRRILHSLEDAGEIVYDPGRGRGRRTYYLVAIALEAPQIKEIAMRRFQMDEAEATAFVSEIITRKLKHQLDNASSPPLNPPIERKGANQPPFRKKEGQPAPFSKKEAEKPPFQQKKGGPPAREKGAAQPPKRGPYGPQDTSIDTSGDPSTKNDHQQQQDERRNHVHMRADVVVGQEENAAFSIRDAFHLAGIKQPTAKRIPQAWQAKTGQTITPADILAWHYYREAENLTLPPAKQLRVGSIIRRLEAGEPADEPYYDQARSFLADRAFANAPAVETPEDRAVLALRQALEAYLPTLTDVRPDALETIDAARAQLPALASALIARGIVPEDLNDLRLYLFYTGQPIPLPAQVALTLGRAGADFRDWRQRHNRAQKTWQDILTQMRLSLAAPLIRHLEAMTPVDYNDALILAADEFRAAFFHERLQTVFHQRYPHLPIQIISP